VAIKTYPNIVYIISKLVQYNKALIKKALTTIKHIIKYLKGSYKKGTIFLKIPNSIKPPVAYTNSN
jgi:hypothetical protein